MRGSIRGNGATGDCDEMELDANGASVPSSPGCFDSALSTPDVQKPRLDFETLETLDSVSLEPVGPSQGGEGFPYAPDEWPNPGDKWKWKVGRRRNAAGFWADRYLILPKTLQCGRRQVWFTSKSSVEKYLKKSFPDADHQTFFDSFQWQIPCTTPLSPTSAENNNEEGIAYAVKRLRESNSKCDGETPVKIHCKAGNAKCHLETGTGKFSNAVDCDICCVESGFCRECSCILCGKSIDQELGEYYFVQCEGNQGEDLICGHAAHLECAVICQTAGVVRNIGLDVEYYCRRCDKKTDLLKHVLGLIPTPELSKTADFKSNLNLALRLVQGTQQYGARILENLLQNAVKKLQSGMKLQDIFGDLQNSSVTVNAVWEGASMTPDQAFEELALYTGAYANANIDTAAKLKEFVQQKDEKICQLEQDSSQIRSQMEAHIALMRSQFESENQQKDAQMKDLQEQVKLAKASVIDLAKFKHEATDINQQLQHEQGLFCDKLNIVKVQGKLVNSFLNDILDMETGYDEAKLKLTELLSWQKDKKRHFPNLPKIKEMQKSIVLHTWKAQIRLAKELVEEVEGISSSVVQLISQSLKKTRLLPEDAKDALPEEGVLKPKAQSDRTEARNRIEQLLEVNFEMIWEFLVKPHSYLQVTKVINEQITQMLPVLEAHVYNCQVNIRPQPPPKLVELLEVYNRWQSANSSSSTVASSS